MVDEVDRKKLIEYLPPFMRQFAEIKQIMNVENAETDQVNRNIQQVLDSAFIKTCSERGIQNYEKMLDIVPNAEDALELRKLRVLMYWNNSLPYTMKTLIKKLITYCGEDGFYVSKKDLTSYHLLIEIFSGSQGQLEELKKVIGLMVPMNMYFILSNVLEANTRMDLYYAGVPCISECIEISEVEGV